MKFKKLLWNLGLWPSRNFSYMAPIGDRVEGTCLSSMTPIGLSANNTIDWPLLQWKESSHHWWNPPQYNILKPSSHFVPSPTWVLWNQLPMAGSINRCPCFSVRRINVWPDGLIMEWFLLLRLAQVHCLSLSLSINNGFPQPPIQHRNINMNPPLTWHGVMRRLTALTVI